MRLCTSFVPFPSILTSHRRHSGSDREIIFFPDRWNQETASLVFWLAAQCQNLAPIYGECVCRLYRWMTSPTEETLGRLM